MTSSPQGNPTGKKSSSGSSGMDTFKGILIMLLLIVLAGTGGYFFGAMQQLAPIRKVPPGTPGALESTPAQSGAGVQSPATSELKKHYWIHSSGEERVGYNISITINGTPVGMVNTPKRNIDISKLVKPGVNHILFQAKSLPVSQRDTSNSWPALTLEIMAGDKTSEDFGKGDVLLQYARKVTETQDYNDNMEFMIVEQ
jgi:hypothetical protein